MTEAIMRRTPIYPEHIAAGARLVPFAGFEMPIQYEAGIMAEHHAVRSAAGLFDVSHMGEFEISGPQALDLVQFLTSNDAASLEPGHAQYSTLLRADGTVVDDLLVYRLAESFMLVVNAANRAKDLAWIEEHAPRFDASLLDRSDQIALIALQGPLAAEILQPLMASTDLGPLRYYRFLEAKVAGVHGLVSRTGYTGEDGFELYVAADDGAPLWRELLQAGQSRGILPIGLGARDSLRLEMGYALYGSDLDDTRTPLEADLGWIVKLGKGDFIASDALREQKERGVRERLIGFRLVERGFPRPGYDILDDGRTVGKVTSGTLGPSIGAGIGLGYVPTELSRPGTRLDVLIRGVPIPAEVVKTPFYTSGSLRK